MSHHNNTQSLDFSYLAVILLLAYFLTSAPKYIRNFRQNHEDIKIERVSPLRQVIKYAKFYTVDPYVNAWNKLHPSPSKQNLAGLR